jgi:nitrite reductase (NO-forming)
MAAAAAATEKGLAFLILGLMVGAGAMAGGFAIGSFSPAGPASGNPPAANNSTSQAVHVTVHQTGFRFSPASIEVAPGTIVTWVNDDDTIHTVTSDETSGPLQSPNMAKGATFEYTFATEGTFAYHCIPHAAHDLSGHGPMYTGMVGTVVVKAAPSGGTTDAGGHKPLPPAKPVDVAEIGRSAFDVPAPITRTTPQDVDVFLETREVVAFIDPAANATYTYWTFNGTVPGPMIRVMVNDTVHVHLSNPSTASMTHSIDLHAVMGPGGGATVTQVAPGETKSFSFKAMRVGLYVYHCASPPVDWHIANGMYGMILVEPEGGLPAVDREYYVMQGEFYTNGTTGEAGHHFFDSDNLLKEQPTYVVFNGRKGSLMQADRMLTANVNETVRIFFAVGGPNLVSSFHVIGQIFDRVYPEGDLVDGPHHNIQTTLVPAGGAAVVEFVTLVPGTFLLVDHSITRTIWQGSLGGLVVTGPAAPEVYSTP